jgi:WD40 repeat protein
VRHSFFIFYSATLSKLELLAVGEADGDIILWDISDPVAPIKSREISLKKPIAHIAFSPNETSLLFLGDYFGYYSPTGYMRDLTRPEYSENRSLFELNTTDIFIGGNNYIGLLTKFAGSYINFVQSNESGNELR